MQYIPPLVFSATQLLDPALTGIISWAFGIEGIPDAATWIGGLIVMSGVGLLSAGEHLREQKEQHEHDSATHERDIEMTSPRKRPSVDDTASSESTMSMSSMNSSNPLLGLTREVVDRSVAESPEIELHMINRAGRRNTLDTYLEVHEISS